jgi:hypothetical protein
MQDRVGLALLHFLQQLTDFQCGRRNDLDTAPFRLRQRVHQTACVLERSPQGSKPAPEGLRAFKRRPRGLAILRCFSAGCLYAAKNRLQDAV